MREHYLTTLWSRNNEPELKKKFTLMSIVPYPAQRIFTDEELAANKAL